MIVKKRRERVVFIKGGLCQSIQFYSQQNDGLKIQEEDNVLEQMFGR
jgi:hypothetical protein